MFLDINLYAIVCTDDFYLESFAEDTCFQTYDLISQFRYLTSYVESRISQKDH